MENYEKIYIIALLIYFLSCLLVLLQANNIFAMFGIIMAFLSGKIIGENTNVTN